MIRLSKLFSKNSNDYSKKNEYKRETAEEARNKKQGRNLPYWVIYIGWARKLIK